MNMKNRQRLYCFLVFVLSLGVVELRAQQQVQYTQYYINPYALNQAAGGVSNYTEATVASRFQWLGFKDAPKTVYASFFTPYNRKPERVTSRSKNLKNNWNTFGAYLYNDVTGPTKRKGAYMSFGHNMALARRVRVSFALTGGIQDFSYSGEGLEIADDGDGLLEATQNKIVPDLNVGVWLYADFFHVGLSSNQILKNKLEFDQFSFEAQSNLVRHYFLQSYYKFQVSAQYNLFLMTMTKFVPNTPVSPEVGLILKNEDVYWIGGNYRFKDAIAVIAGTRLSRSFDLSYSFGVSLSPILGYNAGNHEIVITYKKEKKQGPLCPSKFW